MTTAQHPPPEDTLPVRKPLDSALIHWRCQRRDHLPIDRASRVFVYDNAWAYCDAGRVASGHQLLRTGGVSLHRLEAAFGRSSHAAETGM